MTCRTTEYKAAGLILGLLFSVLAAADESAESRVVQNLNSGWKFYKGDAKAAYKPDFDDGDWRNVNIPHDWSIEGPYGQKWASGTGYLPGGVGWYRKAFISPPLRADPVNYKRRY